MKNEEIIRYDAIKLLENLGYKYISSKQSNNMRSEILSDVIFKEVLEKKLYEINNFEYKGEEKNFSLSTIQKAIKEIEKDIKEEGINQNERIYNLLIYGKSFQENMSDGIKRSYDIKYIDFDNIENNEFYVAEDFKLYDKNKKIYIRFDIALFVNGILLALIECKYNKMDIKDIAQNVFPSFPDLNKFVQIFMITNEKQAIYSACVGNKKNWFNWNEEDKNWQDKILKECIIGREITKQDEDIVSLFERKRFLELIKDFINFDEGERKVCRYQQFFCVKAVIKNIKENRKGGVVWHTQGAGKSITMVNLARRLMTDKSIKNARIIVVTDRKELDKQIHKIFNKMGIKATNASTGMDLLKLIKSEGERVITTVINKFEAVVRLGIEIDAENTFIIIDEAHRTQYGAINKKMQMIFKGAIYISFTGTPIMRKDRNTFNKFGGLIHKYSLNDALNDKVILPIIYENMTLDINTKIKDVKTDVINKNLICSNDERLEKIACSIANNFFKTLKGTGFNAIFACDSRLEAVKYYNIFKEKYPDLKTAVVISHGTRGYEDDDIIQKYYEDILQNYTYEEVYEEITKSRFVDGEIDILIVVNRFLTGLDAPRASTLYLDKEIKGHALLQAIARVNRRFEGKEYGYVIDYRGILEKIDDALAMYQKAGLEDFQNDDIKRAVYYIDTVIFNMFKEYKKLQDMFVSIEDKENTQEYEALLEDENARQSFYNKLSKFGINLAVIIPSAEANSKIGNKKMEEIKKEFIFYYKIRESIKVLYFDEIKNDEYEIKIRKFLKDFINVKDFNNVEEISICDKEKFDTRIEKMKSDKVKAETIRKALERVISEKIEEEPIYYKRILDRIEEVKQKYKGKKITDYAYLKKMQKLKDDFRNVDIEIDYPSNITQEITKTIYRVIYDKLISKIIDIPNCEELGEVSLNIQNGIEEKIKRDWHDNKDIHNEIAQIIDGNIFMYATKNDIALDINELDKLIEEILNIALIKY